MIKEIQYPYPVKRHFILHNHVELAYMDEGDGENTILFIHGLGQSGLSWTKNIATLKAHSRCIAIDLPGNGLSSHSMDYPYSMYFFVQCIYHFVQEMNLKNVYIAGHSMGGQISVLYAHLFPETIKGLFLIAPAGLETFNQWEKILYQNTLQVLDWMNTEEGNLRQAIRNSFFNFPSDAERLLEKFIALIPLQGKAHYRYMLNSCVNGMLTEVVAPFLSELQMPTVVIFGEKDGLIPNKFIHPISVKSFATKAVKAIPNAELYIIPQSGHFVQWEAAKEVNNIIQNHLK